MKIRCNLCTVPTSYFRSTICYECEENEMNKEFLDKLADTFHKRAKENAVNKKEFLDKFLQIWEKNPDIRFLQLIYNMCYPEKTDMFYITDHEFYTLLCQASEDNE